MMEARGPETLLSGFDTVLAVQQALEEAGIEITQNGLVTRSSKKYQMMVLLLNLNLLLNYALVINFEQQWLLPT